MSPEPTPVDSHPRVRRALFILALAYVAAATAASLHPSPATWGIDLAGYLSATARWSLIVLAWAGVALLALGLRGSVRGSGVSDRAPWIPWVLLPAAFATLWLLRTRTHLLGDQQIWMDVFRAGQHPLFSEPLAAGVWYLYVGILKSLGWDVSASSLAVLPALCGAVAAFLIWKIAGLLTPPGKARILPFGLLFTLGAVQLYCGYIESYPIASLALWTFLWLGLRSARSEGSTILPGLALVVAVASHLAMLYLVPSYLYLAFSRGKPEPRHLVVGLAPLALGMVALVILAAGGADLLNPFRTVWQALQVAARTTPPPGSNAVLGPAADLANLVLLIAPVPFLMLAARVLGAGVRKHSWRPDHVFLGIAAIFGMIVAGVLVVPGSPAQDWDLLSLAVVPLAVLAVARSDGVESFHDMKPVGAGLLALSLASASAFVLVNADPQAGVRRFARLVSPEARLSVHERAYGNEKLMVFHSARGETDSALVYARRALQANPANARYWTNVGLALYRAGRYEEAIPLLEGSLQRDPSRWVARFDLGLCYLAMERYAPAAEHLALAVRSGAERPDAYHSLGMALYRSGRPDSAVTVWREILVRWPEYADALRRQQTGSPAGVMDTDAAEERPAP